jgi:lipopolysaccharide exporter
MRMWSRFSTKLKGLLHDPFWRSAGNLFSGAAIAQALPILIFPLLTRIYPKVMFDVYFIYSGIILLTKIIATLQYQLALLIPRADSDARTLLIINSGLSVFVSFILTILIFTITPVIEPFIESKELINWLYYIPLSTFFLGIFECFMYYLNRLKKYSFITYGRVSKGLILVATQTTFGFLGFTIDGLLYGLLLAQGISAILMVILTFHSDPNCFVYNRGNIGSLLRKYKDMPLYNTLISFTNNLSNQLPVFILTNFYGSGASGDFGMANKIVNTPMWMIANSVGQVYHKEINDIMHSKRDLLAFTKRLYRNMFRIGLTPFTILIFAAPWIFSWLLSEEYTTTGYMAQILVPFYFISFMNNPATALFTMLNRQKAGAIYQIALLIGRIVH